MRATVFKSVSEFMAEENKELALPEGMSETKEELLEKLRHVEPEPSDKVRCRSIPRKEDKPKIRNRCGDCAAFHTHFCPFELTETFLMSINPFGWA